MKLLKLLATGIVALAISTNVMANSAKLVALKRFIRCQAGTLINEKKICIGGGYVLDIPPAQDGPVQEGIHSSAGGSLGLVGQSPSGRAINQAIKMQDNYANDGAFPPASTTIATYKCANLPGNSFLPSMVQLRLLKTNLTKLLISFELDQADPNTLAYKANVVIRAAILVGLKILVNRTDEMLSANEDPSDPTRAQTLLADGTTGSVAKDATSNFVCISRFNAGDAISSGLLSGGGN